MALSNDIIKAFSKLTDNKIEDTGTSVKGTFKVINGKEYVQLDGSEILTPVITSVEAVPDERVMVLIKDHIAKVTENITSPAARNKSVEDLKDEVDEQGNTIQQMDNTIIQQNNSIIQMNNSINQQNTSINQIDTKVNQLGDTIVSLENTIVLQGNNRSQMNNTIVEQGNTIDSMNNTIIEHGNNINSIDNIITQHSNTIEQQGNTIEQQGNQIIQINNIVTEHGNNITLIDNKLNVQESNITILNSGFKIVNNVLTGLSEIIIDDLKTNNLNAEYAKIDFANIEMAAVEKLFTESGIIKDLIVEEGHISGELVGVTIKGDLIEGNTIVADKLVVKGSDGIYYKLNLLGETIESEQTDQNSLNGSIITAKSITASKISVTDLVAFGATIAGFIINDISIHSGVKNSINSNDKGLYMDKDGQFYIGDLDNHVQYYINSDGEYVLDIRANNIYIGSGDKTIGDSLSEIEINSNQIRQSVEVVNESLNNNYLTISQTNSLINDASQGLMNTFSKAGGNNLIKNYSLFFGVINNYDYWDGNVEQIDSDLSISKKAMKLKNGVVRQSILDLGSGDFSLRFGFKKIGSGVDTVLQYKINDTIFDILQDEGFVEFSFKNVTGSDELSFLCNQDDQFIIYDIMMNYGKEVYLPCQQAMNELKSTTVSISENIKVESNISNTITTLGTEGLTGYNKSNGEIVFKQTETGLYSAFMKADAAEISDIIIKKIGNQVWITGR